MFKHLLLGFVGITSGFAVSAGTFAFIIVIGVVPRMIGKSKTAKELFLYETAIVLGGIIGNILSVFTMMPVHVGRWILPVYGISTGIFVGCIAVALAEILNTFPVTFRRLNLKTGLNVVMPCMALGKMAGSFWYFLMHMAK